MTRLKTTTESLGQAAPSVLRLSVRRVASLLGRVRQQAERFHRREKELEQAREDLATAMRAAYEEGVPIARIAREAGVSRPTAYDWLRRR
jgi:DNA invertase Pin-like site-specific DNA recombinase